MTARVAEDEVRRALEETRRARALDDFAANVLAFRRIARLSQEEAAVRAGLHRTEISLLERAGRMPRLDTVVRVAAGVDAEPADLLEGLAWEIDRERWPQERPLHERADRVVEGLRTIWAAGGWTRVGRG